MGVPLCQLPRHTWEQACSVRVEMDVAPLDLQRGCWE